MKAEISLPKSKGKSGPNSRGVWQPEAASLAGPGVAAHWVAWPLARESTDYPHFTSTVPISSDKKALLPIHRFKVLQVSKKHFFFFFL